ncbi:MAG TPA: phytanoyl-CoA dioxygenase family protein [Planctomycetota bacterium]|nr:phytanoyl-CoA dioxygenase family protein [Planctomycetota bacterium]
MNAHRILTSPQIAEFEERGFVVLRHAFSSVVAARVRTAIWQKLGLDAKDPSAWPAPMAHLQDGPWGAPFSGALTGRFTGALDDLLGAGRWKPLDHTGWWPVAFPVAPAGDAASHGDDGEAVGGWRIGAGQGPRRLAGIDHGLNPLFLFSDVGLADGGPLVIEGSHLTVARAMAAAGLAGLSAVDLAEVARRLPKPRATRVVGRLGDIVLIHPLTVHAASANAGRQVRFVAAPQVGMREALRTQGEDLSAVERAMARGASSRGPATVGAL